MKGAPKSFVGAPFFCFTSLFRRRSATNIANSGIYVKIDMKLTQHKTVAQFMHYVHTEDKPVRDATELVANRRKTITTASRTVEATA